jgi:hypothetical protein
MASTEVQDGYRGDYAGRGVNAGSGARPNRQGRGIFISTEARPGFITTEFWLTILGVAAMIILAYSSDALGVRWGLGMATVILLGYVLSRGIAKAGSNEVVRTEDN